MFIFDGPLQDLLLSTLAKSRFFFVVKAKIYRQLCFFSFRFFHVFFTLLKPNFKTDPISKVPLLPFTSVGVIWANGV
ncbi:unnamed protein product [Rhizophagus irregularis]|nr:unnamed protein product [Rhizophagus irregularis]